MNNGHGGKNQTQSNGESFENNPFKTAQWFSFGHYFTYTDVQQTHTRIRTQVAQF